MVSVDFMWLLVLIMNLCAENLLTGIESSMKSLEARLGEWWMTAYFDDKSI